MTAPASSHLHPGAVGVLSQLARSQSLVTSGSLSSQSRPLSQERPYPSPSSSTHASSCVSLLSSSPRRGAFWSSQATEPTQSTSVHRRSCQVELESLRRAVEGLAKNDE